MTRVWVPTKSLRETVEMRLILLGLLAALVGVNCQYWDPCGTVTYYNGTNGTIYSPFYPNEYLDRSNCTYYLNMSRISSITLTIHFVDLESCCDYIELNCRSHPIDLPLRITGRDWNLPSVTFSVCTQVVLRFFSDVSITGNGYSIGYQASPIVCRGNCTPISNSFGYVCPCDTNQTNVTLPTAAPYPTCRRAECILNNYPYYYCRCTVHGTTPTTSTTRLPSSPASATCAPGCYRTTDWWGTPSCTCPSSTNRPITCPTGCYQASDFWGNPYCHCPASTQPPIWCSTGCTRSVDADGNQYCNCPTTTLPPCYSPCYLAWNDTAGRRTCYCPPTTTQPPATGCNQTLTASFGLVTSPNYPNRYPAGVDCYQYISVPTAASVRIKVVDVNLYSYYYYTETCQYDYVEITGCDDDSSIFCTMSNARQTFLCTDTSLITIRFHSYSTSYYYTNRGFKLSYTASVASNCSESGAYVQQGTNGAITSPNYPNNFPSYSECSNYLFTDDTNVQIRLWFESLRLEPGTTCANVFLKLTCQDINGYSQTFCGSSIPSPLTVDCRVLQIWFKSNSTARTDARFFKIRYYGVPKTGTTISVSPTVEREPVPSHLSERDKLGIGLGVGIGGFLLLLLIVVIAVCFLQGHREERRREQRRLEELSVICRSINGPRTADAGGNIEILNSGTRATRQEYENPMAMESQPYLTPKQGFLGAEAVPRY